MSESTDRLESIRKARAEWHAREVEGAKLRKKEFLNGSGYKVRELYDPTDSEKRDYMKLVFRDEDLLPMHRLRDAFDPRGPG